jgi:hypothetical protein
MANGRSGSRRKTKPDRDGGGFVALPWAVLDSKNFQNLSHAAKSLLLEFARQYGDGFNGRLLCSMRYLKARGFHSSDVVTRAKRELIDAGFIFETVMGHRPNKASWYAVTWYPLSKIPGYDAGAEKLFVRSAYSKDESLKITPLISPSGTAHKTIAPYNGIRKASSIPSDGSIKRLNGAYSIPPDGNHLENHLN